MPMDVIVSTQQFDEFGFLHKRGNDFSVGGAKLPKFREKQSR